MVVRNDAGQLGMAAAQDVLVDNNYLAFGMDLLESKRGTGREIPKVGSRPALSWNVLEEGKTDTQINRTIERQSKAEREKDRKMRQGWLGRGDGGTMTERGRVNEENQ